MSDDIANTSEPVKPAKKRLEPVEHQRFLRLMAEAQVADLRAQLQKMEHDRVVRESADMLQAAHRQYDAAREKYSSYVEEMAQKYDVDFAAITINDLTGDLTPIPKG